MPLTPADAMRKRVATWIDQAKPLSQQSTWSESRLAIDLGGHTYIVNQGQIFQCAHCGRYDPEWSATEVINYFESNLGAKSYEIEIICSVVMVSNDEN